MVICSVYHSTDKFTYKNGVFSAEISDFMDLGCFDGRVFDDAIDTGFIMVSHRTGSQVLYVHSGADKHEGEEMGWRYKPHDLRTGHALREGQPGYGTEVLLIND